VRSRRAIRSITFAPHASLPPRACASRRTCGLAFRRFGGSATIPLAVRPLGANMKSAQICLKSYKICVISRCAPFGRKYEVSPNLFKILQNLCYLCAYMLKKHARKSIFRISYLRRNAAARGIEAKPPANCQRQDAGDVADSPTRLWRGSP
jgi:hypothetical protein